MDLLACIDLALFDLQLLARLHPDWCTEPMAVLAEDRPTARVLVANAAAQARGILAGHRYNQALACAPNLRAGVITAKVQREALATLAELLRRHSPDLEPSTAWPGVFWLSARGMGQLYTGAKSWAQQVAADLRQAGWAAHIVVGATRFATYAAARGLPDPLETQSLRQRPAQTIRILKPSRDQRQALSEISLDRLHLEPSTRDALAHLGITRLGALLRLPPSAVHERFGSDVAALFALAGGEAHDPLRAQIPLEPLVRTLYFDEPQADLPALLFAIKREMVGLREALVGRASAISLLFLSFILDRHHARQHLEVIQPAQPTLDVLALVRLIHLRLEAQPLPAAVRELHLSLAEAPALQQQLELFSHEQERNLHAAADALARVRAEIGNDAVVQLVAGPGHLPEAIAHVQAFTQVVIPSAQAASQPTLVRRLLRPTRSLPAAPPPNRQQTWQPMGAEHGRIEEIIGPYVFAGGWWRTPIQRDYYFLRTALGSWLWAYYDGRRRQWHLQAQVG